MSSAPFSAAAERNQAPILAVLQRLLPAAGQILEIGSGTGQHARCFATANPDWHWQPSEHPDQFDVLKQGLSAEPVPKNLLPPLKLDVCRSWPAGPYSAVFSANTAHIMSSQAVEAMLVGVADILEQSGIFILYGPFVFADRPLSPSNQNFDQSLRLRDASMGLRDVARMDQAIRNGALERTAEVAMPANNHLLVFEKTGGAA